VDDETRDVIRAGAPGALEALTAAGLHALGADPITSAIGGLMVGTAWTLDQVGFPLRLARGQRVVDETASVIGSEAEVVRLAISNDQRLELTMHVLEAAARTTRDDKLRALGRVLANGLMNDKVDEAGFLTAALTAMEAPHIQVLHQLQQFAADVQIDPAPNTDSPGWTEKRAMESMPQHSLVMPAILNTLNAHGLLANVGQGTFGNIEDGPCWVTSPLGNKLLELLRAKV